MSVRMETVSEKETEIIINESIKVKISADSFNSTGEMTIEYDEKLLTEAEASEIANDYFSKVLHLLNQNQNTTTGETE